LQTSLGPMCWCT